MVAWSGVFGFLEGGLLLGGGGLVWCCLSFWVCVAAWGGVFLFLVSCGVVVGFLVSYNVTDRAWAGVPRWSRDLVLVSWAVFGGLLGIW